MRRFLPRFGGGDISSCDPTVDGFEDGSGFYVSISWLGFWVEFALCRRRV